MPASTSTLTTSRPDNDNDATARLRTSPPPGKESAPPLEVKENDFFWTYTEEPHRTRRQAIIKAYPEVVSELADVLSLCC
jgi:sphingolipid delta-4 desaturase